MPLEDIALLDAKLMELAAWMVHQKWLRVLVSKRSCEDYARGMCVSFAQ